MFLEHGEFRVAIEEEVSDSDRFKAIVTSGINIINLLDIPNNELSIDNEQDTLFKVKELAALTSR